MSNLSETPNLDDGVEEAPTQDAAGDPVPEAQRSSELIRPVETLKDFQDLEVHGTKSSLEKAQAEELANLRRRASELEISYQSAIRERELAKALAGRPLVPGAIAQLIKLWNSDLDVFEESGMHKVASRDGRPVSEAVADWLAQPEYAHFCRPTSRGGTSTPGTNRSLSDASVPSRPLSLGEAVLQRWRDTSASRPESASLPNGFGRTR